MRIFIAIELSKQMRMEMTAALKELKQRSNTGRFVPEQNLHITLHFLGEQTDLNGAVNAMKEAVRGIKPFTLCPGEYDCFERKGSNTSFITVQGELNELEILHEALECALSDNGFSREYRRFIPHITLGRSVVHDELSTAELKMLKFTSSTLVNSISLFESTKEKGIVKYNCLHKESF